MTPKRRLQILRKARALLAAGWCQIDNHRRRNGQDLYCAQAAISMAATGDDWSGFPDEDEFYAPLNELARQRMPSLRDDRCPVTTYNDTRKRTQAQVLSLFDDAIQQCESLPSQGGFRWSF